MINNYKGYLREKPEMNRLVISVDDIEGNYHIFHSNLTEITIESALIIRTIFSGSKDLLEKETKLKRMYNQLNLESGISYEDYEDLIDYILSDIVPVYYGVSLNNITINYEGKEYDIRLVTDEVVKEYILKLNGIL